MHCSHTKVKAFLEHVIMVGGLWGWDYDSQQGAIRCFYSKARYVRAQVM